MNTLRELRSDEAHLLQDFLYEAIFVPAGVTPPEKSIVELPELALYYENFGSKQGDNCIAADLDGKIIGAVWTRIVNDYGHIDDETPSLAISLYKEFRGKGIGKAMMLKMLELLREQGYRQVSLSVQKANYAVKMYLSLGFRIIREHDEEFVMVCNFQQL